MRWPATIDPKCKQCRREGMKLFLKGERCLTEKCAIERRAYPPGQHGRGRIKQSRVPACSCARSRRRAATTACSSGSSAPTTRRRRARRGITGENLLRLLETRLDNVVYRLGFAASRAQARQFVRARPLPRQRPARQYPLLPGPPDDVVSLREGSAAEAVDPRGDRAHRVGGSWLQADHDNLVGKVLRLPEREEIDTPVQEQLIVELYSK